MNEPTGAKNPSGCLQPLFKTKADVIERNAVGIKTFATESKYGNLLRCEVQHLTELHLLLPYLFLGLLTLGDVDDGTHELNEIPRSIEDQMAYAVNVPDPLIRMN